jgi:hypothetical protein
LQIVAVARRAFGDVAAADERFELVIAGFATKVVERHTDSIHLVIWSFGHFVIWTSE